MNQTLLPDGYGTFIVAGALLLSMMVARFGFDVAPSAWEGFLTAGVMILMRFRTTKPPGGTVESKINIMGVGK